MESTKYKYNTFDPTPKLKSSSLQVFFVSFLLRMKNCINCGSKYNKNIMKIVYHNTSLMLCI